MTSTWSEVVSTEFHIFKIVLVNSGRRLIQIVYDCSLAQSIGSMILEQKDQKPS
jgi:hypothetical protein